MQRHYDLNGLALTVETEIPELMALVQDYVAPFFCAAPPPESAHSLWVGRTLAELPADAEVTFEGEVAPAIPSRTAIDGARRWLSVPGQFSLFTDSATEVTRIGIAESCDPLLRRLAGIHALDIALAASGQYLLHGAALALPQDASRTLLIFAPSGAGKTTAALALALGGFGLMTDDAIVLQPQGYRGGTAFRAWGLPRALKVHRATAALLPALAPVLGGDWDSSGEQALGMAALGKVASVAPPVPVRVAAVAVLADRSSAGHQFAPIDKASALLHLTHDNLRRSPAGVPPDHVKRFAVLGALVAAVPAYQLRVASPLASLPDSIAAELAERP